MRSIAVALLGGLLFAAEVPLRSRVEAIRGSNQWQVTTIGYDLKPERTAIVVCDMWDRHWCKGASARVDKLAPAVDATLAKARRSGILIIHAPSDTMGFYAAEPQRAAILNLERVKAVEVRQIEAPRLPIDDSSGGCDTGDKSYKAWTRQHPGIAIEAVDLISDKGDEIYSALKLRGITDLLVMGVHTNMCILNRSFAIKQMTKWGIRCILVRDLTDAMYDPKDRPYVSHEQGTQLVIEHIEKYWSATMLSGDLAAALGH